MDSAYVAIGTRLSRLLKLCLKNKCAVHPKYGLRFLLLWQSGIWSSVFHIVEKIKYKREIKKHAKPQRPVFIVGHWRTGSTLLHQLMALDTHFATPSVFQVTVPDCYISIERYYKPLMKKVMGKKRPMDNVKFGPDAPQEDEFALLRLTQNSPLQYLLFPKSDQYFLNGMTALLPEPDKISYWKAQLSGFYKKLSFTSRRRILIKNPFHSMRIEVLKEIFPDALFIHIYRNPFDVVPSTARMWDIIGKQNCMNRKWQKPPIKEVADFMKIMLDTISLNFKDLDKNQYVEVAFEDLEKKPVETVKHIYQHLNIPFSTSLEARINEFCEAEKGYVKNTHKLSRADVDIIQQSLHAYIAKHNYEVPQKNISEK